MELIKYSRECFPLTPHLNTPLEFEDADTAAYFYEGTLELLRRCDAVLTVRLWGSSKGTKLEIKEAERLNIPVFKKLEPLLQWEREK